MGAYPPPRPRSLKAAVKRLGRAPLMEGVENHVVERIAREGRLRALKGGARVEQEELSLRLFFVLAGEMRMFRFTPDGQEQLVQRFRAGEFFCLAALVSGCPCRSFLVNFGSTELLVWNRECFFQQMQDCPRLYRNVLCQMACQVEKEREIRSLSRCLRAEVRLAAYLRHQMRSHAGASSQADAIDLRPISLTAQELGMARETLSRCLQRLVEGGVIHHRRGIVQITDKTWLESVLKDFNCTGGHEG